ncbi:MAG: hypothetical protein HC881_13125 [Leptolyngbyaceae cyanobacterium SL_7_1]|nr:hypothetical protein [Leptolyngbyaceae cyanobacterium SL_7_1]
MTISSADRVLLTEEKRSTTLFVAQSNLQLLSQLQREGYSDDDLKKIAAAYDLALQLFTGYFRGNGKSFIAHLVGTASILASVQAPIEVVAAGLLHAAYIWGNFGTGQSGKDKAKCHRIRAVAGWEVESYITNYDAIEWNPQAIALLNQTLDQLHSRDRTWC